MKTAEYESQCSLCEDKIIVGDNIEYCHVRREWYHLSCPTATYPSDMVILDMDDDDEIITIMKHEINKENDRHFRIINEEQTSGEKSGELDNPTKKRSWIEKFWEFISSISFKFKKRFNN